MLRLLRPLVAAVACLLAGAASAQTTLYWDTNGATAGSSAGTTAPGTWGFGSNWSTSIDGTIATQAWSNGANAVFAAGTNATGAYTVGLLGQQTAGQITFASGDVTVSASGLIVPAIEVAEGASATISSSLDFDGFTKSGAGTLTLGGTVTATGLHSTSFNVTAGDVVLSGSYAPLSGLGGSPLDFTGAAGTTFTVANGAAVFPSDLDLSGQLAFNVAAGGTLNLNGNLTVSSGTPTFTMAGGTLVTNTANFIPTVTPQVNLVAGTTSEFNAGSSATLALAGGVSGAGAINKTGAGTLALSGDNTGFSGGTTITAGTVTLGHAGALGTGPLTFAGGNLLVQGVSPTVTPFVIQNGSATVTGSGTVLTSATYAEVGNGGTGGLNISNGAEVSATTSAVAGIGTSGLGTINVDGSGSLLNVGTFFAAGHAAGTTGTLALTNSGAATVGQSALIGYNGTGSLSVASAASFTTTQDLNLGSAATGSGSLTVSGGGTVTTGANAYIGYAGNSTATVSGTNSAWNVASILYTGFGATGSLTIESGGTVAADYVDLARNAGSAGTINVNSGGTLSLGGLTQGAGTAALNLAGGTLGIVNRSFTTSVPLALAASTSSTLSVSGLAVQLDGAISGGGALAKDGVGTVTLNAANTYSGGTTVNAGTLALTNASALGSTAAPLTLNGGALDLGGFSPTTGTVVFNGGTFANGTLAHASAFEVRTGSLSAALTGDVALTKTGTGTFILSGANTYTGATTIDAGTLTLGTATTLGNTASVTVSAGGTLDLNNLTVTLPSMGGTGTVHLGSGDLQLGDATDQTLAASLTGAGTVTKVGSGTLTLTGANTHTGGTRVNAGTIEVANLAPFGTAAVTLNGGGLRWATGTTADISSLGLSLGAGGGTLDTNGNDVSLAFALGGTGSFTKTGEGVLTLNGASTFSGIATIATGTLRLGAANALSGTGGVSRGAVGKIDLNDLAAVRSGSDGACAFALGAGVLTTGNASDQAISALIAGTGSVVKVGAGSLALTGTNTFSGGISVNAGLLEFTSPASFGSGVVTLNGGGLRWAAGNTSDVSAQLGALGAGGGTFNTNGNDVRLATALSGSGALTKSGAGNLTLAASNSYTGGTFVDGGAIEFANLAAFGTGAITLDGGALRWASGNTLDVSARLAAFGAGGGGFDTNGNDVTFAAALPGTGTLTKTGPGTLTLTAVGTAGTAHVTGGTLAIAGAGASLTTGDFITVGDATSDTGFRVAAGGQVSSASVTMIGDTLGGTASLVVDGSGSRFTSADALYLGHTGTANATVSAGAQLYSSTSITVGYHAQSSGNLTISDGGVVSSNGSITLGDEYTNDPFGPSGSAAASGTIIVTGSGSRLEAGGNLIVGNLGVGNLTIADGAVVTVGGYAQLGGSLSNVFGVVAIGDGTLNLNTGGTLEIGGADAFRRSIRSYLDISQGNITVASDHFNLSGGTLKVTSPLTSTVPVILTNASTIDTQGTSAGFSGGFSGPGGLAKTGAGTLTLSAANTYSGATMIDAGTLALGAGGSLASSSIHVAGGATFDTSAAGGFTLASGQSLTGSGTVAGNLTVAAGAHLTPGDSPGTLTFTQGLTLHDGAVLDLQLGSASDLVRVSGGLLTGSASAGGITLNLADAGGFAPATYVLFDFTGATLSNVDLSDFSLGTTIAGYDYSFALDGSALSLVATTSAIPEPSAWAAILGCAGLGLAAWRRRSVRLGRA